MQDVCTEVREGPLLIRSRRYGTTHTLELIGEFELSTAPAFSTQLEAALGEGAELVVLDLSELVFIDSSGIALLVEAHHRLNDGADANRFLLIPSPAVEVRRVMAVTGLTDRLPFIEGQRETNGRP